MTAVVVCVLLAVGVSAVAEIIFGRRGPGSGGAAALLLICLMWPDAARAQTPTPTPAFSVEASIVTGRMWKPGEDRKAYVGARTDLFLSMPAGLQLVGRAEATTSQDGAAAESVSITNPETFQSLEVTIGAWRPLFGPIGPAVSYGVSIPMEGGRPLGEAHPQRAFVGGAIRLPGLDIAVGGGIDQMSGLGFKARTLGKVHVEGRTWVGWDAAVGGGDAFLARTYVVVSLGAR